MLNVAGMVLCFVFSPQSISCVLFEQHLKPKFYMAITRWVKVQDYQHLETSVESEGSPQRPWTITQLTRLSYLRE